MIWIQAIVLGVLGLIITGPVQSVQAKWNLSNLKVQNFTHGKPGNKTHYSALNVDHELYMKFACQKKQNGLRLPVEGSCTQYLECQRGSAKLMNCPMGKHFSTLGLTCIDVRLSNCTVNCECCGKKDGLYPDVSNCANYVVCLKEKAYRQNCGSTLKFNSDNLMCDIPQRAKCFEKPNNTQSLEVVEGLISKTPVYLVSHRVCQNKSNGYTVGVEKSCNKYYLCLNGKGYLKSCGNMQFDSEEHFCNRRTKIFCPEFEEHFIIMESDEIPKEWLRPITEIPQHSEAIQDLQPPHRVPGKPFPQESFPNEYPLHPPVAGKPDHPQDHLPGQKPPVLVDPVPEPPTIVYVPDPQDIINPKDYHKLCADQSVGALIALSNHCNKYIRCKWDWYQRRVAEVESCPKHKHFNAKTKVCDVPEKAGCAFPIKMM